MNDLQTFNAPPSQMYWELKIPPFDDLLQSVIQFEVDKDKPQHIPFLSFSSFLSECERNRRRPRLRFGGFAQDSENWMHNFDWIFKKEKEKVIVELSHKIYLPTLFTSFRGIYFFWQGNNFLLRLRYLNNSLWSQFTAISTLSLPHVISYPEIQVSQFSSKITLIQICCCRVQPWVNLLVGLAT